jgi:AhpD family alkylhydroperoxidase
VRPFAKRRYHRVADLLADGCALWRQRRGARAVTRGAAIDAAFRERLMLAVTEVNGCRYCSYAHARTALAVGLSQTDVEALARGEMEGAPPEQVPARLYARHWAETDARPDPDVRRRVLETYGETDTRHIELALRMIRVGNLMGNTADSLLYRFSLGRCGDARPEPSPE